jgi:hypothetical protein
MRRVLASLAVFACIFPASDATAGTWVRNPIPPEYEGGLHWDISFPMYEVEICLARMMGGSHGVVILDTSRTLCHHPFTMGYFSACFVDLPSPLITDSIAAELAGYGRAEDRTAWAAAPIRIAFYSNGQFHPSRLSRQLPFELP